MSHALRYNAAIRVAFPGLLALAAVLSGCAETTGLAEGPLTPAEVEQPPPRRDGALGAVTAESGNLQVAAVEPSDAMAALDAAPEAEANPAVLDKFGPLLAPHGTWTDDATYGRVWTPSRTVVGADFAPYVTAGHWSYADDYVWVSDYDWGWAPFHYGRWVWISGRGWSWIPGSQYAGAWVVWRVGPSGFGYVGWAPAPPFWGWRNRATFAFGAPPPAAYVFCPTNNLFHGAGPHGHLLRGLDVRSVAGQTRPYIPARPTVSEERVLARPIVAGPPPHDVGIKDVAPAPPQRRLAQLPAVPSSGVAMRDTQVAAPSASDQGGMIRVPPRASRLPSTQVSAATSIAAQPPAAAFGPRLIPRAPSQVAASAFTPGAGGQAAAAATAAPLPPFEARPLPRSMFSATPASPSPSFEPRPSVPRSAPDGAPSRAWGTVVGPPHAFDARPTSAPPQAFEARPTSAPPPSFATRPALPTPAVAQPSFDVRPTFSAPASGFDARPTFAARPSTFDARPTVAPRASAFDARPSFSTPAPSFARPSPTFSGSGRVFQSGAGIRVSK